MEYLTLNNGTRMPLVGFGSTFKLYFCPLPITPCSEKGNGAAAAPLRLYLIFSDMGSTAPNSARSSGRIFAPPKFENGGILYVFPIFGTAEVEQKDG